MWQQVSVLSNSGVIRMNIPGQSSKVIVARGNEPWFQSLSTLSIAMELSRWTVEEDFLLTKGPLVLLEQFQSGRNIILLEFDQEQTVRLIGYATLYPLGKNRSGDPYWELGTVVVDKQRRGEHYGTLLYQEVARLHDELGGILIATTKSERVYQIGLAHGLKLYDFRQLEVGIRHALCYDVPCFTPDDTYPSDCSRQHTLGGDCKLRCRGT